ILLATIVNNLATAAYAEKRFAEAEERYDELVRLKRSTFDEDGLVQALEWRGLSQEKQQAYDRAMPSWEEGALICKAFKLQHRLDPMLTHLKRAYEHLNMRDAVRDFDAIWKA